MRAKLAIAAVAITVIVAAAIIWLFPPVDESRIGVEIPELSTAERHRVELVCDTIPDNVNVRFQWNSNPPNPTVYIGHFPPPIAIGLEPLQPVTFVDFVTDEPTPASFGIMHWDSPWQCWVESASDGVKTYRIELVNGSAMAA